MKLERIDVAVLDLKKIAEKILATNILACPKHFYDMARARDPFVDTDATIVTSLVEIDHCNECRVYLSISEELDKIRKEKGITERSELLEEYVKNSRKRLKDLN